MPRLAGRPGRAAPTPSTAASPTGSARATACAPETVATAIRIGDPVSHERARLAIEATSGVVTEVSDEEILEAKAHVDAAGLGCEPASAASLAGVRRLRAEGVIGARERVVCVLTGHLLKDVDAVLARSEGARWSRWTRTPPPVEAAIAPWLR